MGDAIAYCVTQQQEKSSPAFVVLRRRIE